MLSFEKYEDLQTEFLQIVYPLSIAQEQTTPELFAPMADAFLREFNQAWQLYQIEHNAKHQKREAKYKYKLLSKGWKKRMREELGKLTWFDKISGKRKKSVFELVKVLAESEQSERINSESGLCSALDKGEERSPLSDQCETDRASHCLVASSSEAQPGQAEVDDTALPVDLSPGATDSLES